MTTSNIWGNDKTEFFLELSPDVILTTVEKHGFKTTGRVLTLNSMENRVYEVEIESDSEIISEHFKIIKFYRPGRWNFNQIHEEHLFLHELYNEEIPVIAPLFFTENQKEESLFKITNPDLFYTIYNKQGGRAPDEFNDEDCEQLGRLIARMHIVGNRGQAKFRHTINPKNYILSNLEFLLSLKLIPKHLEVVYKNLLEKIYHKINPKFSNLNYQRVHGDCHIGNIIKRNETFHLIDFDDFVIGPKVQDIWLLFPGRDEYTLRQKDLFIDAYKTMNDFDENELELTESLRSLRMINYSAWIAKRYDDLAFKNAFPFFETPNYWEDQISTLNQQFEYL